MELNTFVTCLACKVIATLDYQGAIRIKQKEMTMKILTTTLVALLATTTIASAQDARELSTQVKSSAEQRAYDYEFNRDEQCQGYDFGVKRLGIENPCGKKETAEVTTMTEEVSTTVLNEYVVYFDFDAANIRPSDMDILNAAAREITTYNPSKVLVAGYTDTRGSQEYNDDLSAKRANAVSNYLTSRGVSNFVVDEAALGETSLAVPTADEVKLQENRRVKIQFIR